MRAFLMAVLICVFAVPAMSKPLPETEVIRAAETWLAQGEIMPRSEARVSRVIPHRVADETLAYVLELAGQQYLGSE